MKEFNLETLRSIRNARGLTLTAVAKRLGQSPAQLHRLENGQRRLTVDLLLNYCDAVGIEISRMFREDVMIPIIGVVNDDYEVVPLTPNTPYLTTAPQIVPQPRRMAAVRWEPSKRISKMHGHLMFFYADVEGIPDAAWNQRCIIRRGNGTQRIGWPVREDNQMHIDNTDGAVEFNVDMVWASPILAVFSPVAFSPDLLPPPEGAGLAS